MKIFQAESRDSHAVCKIELDQTSYELYGIDEWQATQIAFQHIKTRVAGMEQQGAKFSNEKGEPVSASIL